MVPSPIFLPVFPVFVLFPAGKKDVTAIRAPEFTVSAYIDAGMQVFTDLMCSTETCLDEITDKNNRFAQHNDPTCYSMLGRLTEFCKKL